MAHYLKKFIFFFLYFMSQTYALAPLGYQITGNSKILSSSIGQQNIAVFLLNFQNNPTEQPWTLMQAQDIVFNQTNQLVRELSYNQTFLNGIVLGYYTLPISSTDLCYPSLNRISNLAITAAQAAGVDLAPYNRHIYMFPYKPNCHFNSHSTIGFDSGISKIWINGNSQPIVYLHGLGHNFGLWHSHYLNCKTCERLEVGDRADVMGSGPGHFNAFQKERLGWLNGINTPLIQLVTSTGDYVIDAFEVNNFKVKALKILRRHLDNGTNVYYYLELRQPMGLDAELATCGTDCNFTKGLLIHMGNPSVPNSSDLMDMSPGDNDRRLVALLPGLSYTDEESENGGVRIKLNSISDATAKVSVIFGSSCQKNQPTLTIIPNDIPTIHAGQIINYSLTLTNNDNEACFRSSHYNLSFSTDSNEIIPSLSTNSLSLSPGQSRDFALSVKSLLSTPSKLYQVKITAARGSAPFDAAIIDAKLNIIP